MRWDLIGVPPGTVGRGTLGQPAGQWRVGAASPSGGASRREATARGVDPRAHVLPRPARGGAAHPGPACGGPQPCCALSGAGERFRQSLRDHLRADQRRARVPRPPVWRQHRRWVPRGAGAGPPRPRQARADAAPRSSREELGSQLVFDACVWKGRGRGFFFLIVITARLCRLQVCV